MRKIGLDILRAIAVILVLFRHSKLENNPLAYFGWLGVDLFFVLSGFLIANILFNEYRQKGQIDIKRFLARRAFKIFPPFYIFVFSTLLFHFLYNAESPNWNLLLSELFYFQNYRSGIWLHTWSLAVEEHFYLVFPVALFFLIKYRLITNRSLVIGTLLSLLILSLLLRLNISYPHRNDAYFLFFQTHMRADGIIMGILLAYLHNFTKWLDLLLKRKRLLFLTSILLVLPGFYYIGGSFFMNTIGLTLVNLGFMLVVLLVWYAEKHMEDRFKILFKPAAFIGINSYSIYLWHLNAKDIIYSIFSIDTMLMTTLYVLLSIITGIIMSYLIEKPFIRLRNYLFKE